MRGAASKYLSPALLLLLVTCHDNGTGPLLIAAISLTPSHRTLPVPQTTQLVATPRDPAGTAMNGATIHWSSSDPSRATVSPGGLVSTHAPGIVTITATSGSHSGIATLNILPAAATVTVAPDTVTVLSGDSLGFRAAVYDSLGNTLGGRLVQWTSSDTTVLTITPDGLVHGHLPGRATVTAQVERARGSATVRVWCSPFTRLEVTPDSTRLSVGEMVTLTANGIDASVCGAAPATVLWRTPEPGLVIVLGNVVTAIGAGRARLIAEGTEFAVRGLTDTAIVRIDPRVATVSVVPESISAYLFALVFPVAIARDSAGMVLPGHAVTWRSSNGTVAGFRHDSLVTSAVGTTTIQATVDGVTGGATVIVDTAPAPFIYPSGVEVLATTTASLTIYPALDQSAALASSDTSIFTLDPADTMVTGVTTAPLHAKAPGLAALIATSQGRVAAARVLVYGLVVRQVTIAPRPFLLRVGDSLLLNADVRYSTPMNPYPFYPILFASSDTVVATVDDSGKVIARSPGRTVLTAMSGGVSDTVTLRVPSAAAPQLAAVDSSPMVAGNAVTIRGANFSAVADSNVVTVGGLPARVSAAAPGEITIQLAAADSYPCRPTAPALLRIMVGEEAAETTAVLRVAAFHQMTAGDTLRLFGAALRCNEFPDGIYLGTIANTGPAPSAPVQFRVATQPVAVRAVAAPRPAARASAAPPEVAPSRALAWAREASRVDQRWLAANQSMLRRSPPPPVAALVAALAAPASGAFRTIRVPIIDAADACTHYTEITTRTAYVGSRVTILEDINGPLQGQLDPLYAAIGAEYDTAALPLLQQTIGPLNGGPVLLVFTPAVNEFGLGAFVAACDLFPRNSAPASNEVPVVYALAADTGAGFSGPFTREVWRWLIRRYLVHEGAHLAVFAERIARGVPPLDPWLQESVASVVEELWARRLYGAAWKGDLDYQHSLYCDVRPTFPECGGRPFAMFGLFSSLYDFDQLLETRSVLGPANGDGVLFPGAGWSFLRWAIDQYATTEAPFIKALVDEPVSDGVTDLERRTGSPFSIMLADWVMASGLDDGLLPGVPARFAIPTWNMHDVFAGMCQDFPDVFTQPYPLPVRSLYYGGVSPLITLSGGGVSYWEPWIGGASVPRFLNVFTPGGASLPPRLTVEVFRQ